MTDTPPPTTPPVTFKSERADTLRHATRERADTAATPINDVPATPTKSYTRLEQIAGLLARPEGASLDELCAATGWQAHSVRGAMAGALKRKGLVVTSGKHEGLRRYRIGTGAGS